MREAVIVSAVRTPLGNFNGALANTGATQLGAIVIEEAVKRAKIKKTDVDEVNYGHCTALRLRSKSGQTGRGESRNALGGRMHHHQ